MEKCIRTSKSIKGEGENLYLKGPRPKQRQKRAKDVTNLGGSTWKQFIRAVRYSKRKEKQYSVRIH